MAGNWALGAGPGAVCDRGSGGSSGVGYVVTLQRSFE